ncbi:hypothetical protein AK812_SmicGene45117 [Symbiodinium microadriaticum]|uniref:C3H1-type domain-containing protein n=1 Tax=Symbiodinium microadriaticum TaxID=2951 RepID=A0A1Q9BWU9_SYMMI|nr:hypothetical protein AK812_SmicGene45117 [Symbiodinium microadriaticum]
MVLGAVVLVMAGYHLELLGCVDGGATSDVPSRQNKEACHEPGYCSLDLPAEAYHEPGHRGLDLPTEACPLDHEDVDCNPCVFYGTRRGCHRDACRYRHTEIEVPARHHQRPRRNARMRLKRTIDSLLEDYDRSPDRVHDELQAWTARSHYARNVLAGN